MSNPSLVPDLPHAEIYLVLDDFGKLGRAYREADPDTADRGTVVQNLVRGEYNGPISIIVFNLAEGWVRDVSEDVARDAVEAARLNFERLPDSAQKFVERHLGRWRVWETSTAADGSFSSIRLQTGLGQQGYTGRCLGSPLSNCWW